MERRDFIAASALGTLAAMLDPKFEAQAASQTASPIQLPNVYNLTTPYTKQSLMELYTGQKGTGNPQAPLPPHILLYYDRTANPPTFVSPSDIKADLDADKYELNATVHAFNIATSHYDHFKNLKQDLQLGLNVATPSADGQDTLTWLFMSAIDVFLQKSTNIPAQLSKFDNYTPTSSLKPSNKITVSQGVINLQVTAFGQRKEGFWKKLFDILSKVASSPLIGAFAIPSLVKESVDFVDKSLNVIAAQDNLVELWETHPMTFGVDKSAKDQDFFLKSGYWVTIDRDFAKQNDYLDKGFSLDLRGQSFQVLKGNANVDTNYMVTTISFTKQKS